MIFFHLIFALGVVDCIKVLQSTSNESATDSSAEILDSDLSGLEEFSLCFRLYSHQFSKNIQTLIVIKTTDDRSLMINTASAPSDETTTEFMKEQLEDKYENGMVYGWLGYPIGGKFFTIWSLGEWHSICLLVSIKESYLKLYLDGMSLIEVENVKISLTSENVLIFKPSHEIYSPIMNTDITDLNIWNTSKPSNFVQKWSKCEQSQEGDILQWSNAKINTSLNLLEMDKEDICKSTRNIIVSDETKTFNDTIRLCKKIGGKMMVANNLTMLDKIALKVGSIEKCKDGFFVGYTDEIEEGKWIDIVNEAQMTIKNWGNGEPNNFQDQDCAYYNFNEGKFHDTFCYSQLCPVCQLETDVLYQFDRMCADSDVDTFYSMKSPREFIGLK